MNASALSQEDRGPHRRRPRPLWRRLALVAFLLAAERPARGPLLRPLLAWLSRRVADCSPAAPWTTPARHWLLVARTASRRRTPERVAGRELAARVDGFRGRVATKYLFSTREADAGTARRRRAAAADRNGGLAGCAAAQPRCPTTPAVTALVEICGERIITSTSTTRRLCRLAGSKWIAFIRSPSSWPPRRRDGRNDLAARAALALLLQIPRLCLRRPRPRKIALYRDALPLRPRQRQLRKLLTDFGFFFWKRQR